MHSKSFSLKVEQDESNQYLFQAIQAQNLSKMCTFIIFSQALIVYRQTYWIFQCMIKNTRQFISITNKNDFGICQKLAITDLKIHELPLYYLKQKKYAFLFYLNKKFNENQFHLFFFELNRPIESKADNCSYIKS